MEAVHIVYTSLIKCLDFGCRCIDILVCRAKGLKEDIVEEEPDDKIMLEAEVEYLKKENSKLKKLYYPQKLIYDVALDIYQCPNCRKILSQEMLKENTALYCSLCGQRIYWKITKSN